MRVATIFLCLAILAGLSLGCDRRAKSTPPAKATYTFDDLKKAAVGKTKEEVKALLGAPDEVFENKDFRGSEWRYHKVIYDKLTEKYSHVSLSFSGKENLCVAVERLIR